MSSAPPFTAAPNQHQSLVSQTLRTLKAHPAHFLALQLPQAMSDIVDNLFPGYFEKHQMIGLAVLMPLWIFLTPISTAMTFASVRQAKSSGGVSFFQSLTATLDKLVPLLFSYLLVGIVVGIGILSVVVPGFYYFALYVFVPMVVMDNPRLPPTVYMVRSKRLAKSSLKRTLVLAFGLFGIVMVLSILDSVLKELATELVRAPFVRGAVFLAATLFLSLVTGATINVGLSEYFLNLKAARENEDAGR